MTADRLTPGARRLLDQLARAPGYRLPFGTWGTGSGLTIRGASRLRLRLEARTLVVRDGDNAVLTWAGARALGIDGGIGQ